MDPIYADLLARAGGMSSEIAAAEKDIADRKAALEEALPQTGQIKVARSRLDEANNRLDKLRQKQKYWEIRAESRKKWDREHYLRAYNEKKAWPDPEEWAEYKAQMALEEAPRKWNVKERLGKQSRPEKKEPSEGGGHH